MARCVRFHAILSVLIVLLGCILETKLNKVYGDSSPVAYQLLDQNSIDDEELSRMLSLDTQLMKDLYLISTDKAYSENDIHTMIHIVSSQSGLKLTDAVTAIVNLKLILRLRFTVLDETFETCARMDSARDSTENKTIGDYSRVNVEDKEDPVCMQDNRPTTSGKSGWVFKPIWISTHARIDVDVTNFHPVACFYDLLMYTVYRLQSRTVSVLFSLCAPSQKMYREDSRGKVFTEVRDSPPPTSLLHVKLWE